MQFKQKVNILLVDDNPNNLLALEAILNNLGQNLVLAHSGEEALRCLLQQDFAVILLDVQMPGMDGFETATLIRERERSRHTPIIFLTAFSTSESFVFRGYSLGAVDYLLKPLEPTILTSKVTVFVELFQKTEEIKLQTDQLSIINGELRQSEERFRCLSACSPVGIFMTDINGYCTYANPRCQSICGFTFEESLGEGWENSLHPDDRDWVVAEWNSWRREGKQYTREFRFLIGPKYLSSQQPTTHCASYDETYPMGRPNAYGREISGYEPTISPPKDSPLQSLQEGIVRWVHIITAPMISDKGELLGHVGTMEDITERKRAEAEIYQLNAELEQRVIERTAQLELANDQKDRLLQSEQKARIQAEAAEQRFRDLINGLGHAIFWEADAATMQFTFVSKSAESILGYPVEKWTIESDFWVKLIHSDEREWAVSLHRQEMLQGRECELEYRCLAADGRLVWLRNRAYVVRDSAGVVQKFRGLMLDITEAKQAQEDLTARALELSRLTNVLTQTNSILQKRNQELDQYAYAISHDLKAPLRAIANLSHWLEEDMSDKLTEDTQHQMNLLRGRVHRMENLIDALLQYSRVGRLNTAVETVDVENLLNEAIDSLAPPPEFTIEIGAEMPTLTTPRILLSQVFSNLINNAIKHHTRPDGKVEISVQDVGNFYEFSVADDGPGIAPQYHEKVFIIFQTLQPRDRAENTGIGLSLVKKIVESEGGNIWIKSEENLGTTIYFTWPKVNRQG